MLQLLDTVLFQPLLAIYAGIFASILPSWPLGFRLMLFGIVVNLLLLPIYVQMERASQTLRDKRELMRQDVDRMRRHFRGRERYFYVRAVHRQYGYRPLAALAGSADLLVQILVFATVYRFLSALPALRGASFGPIPDLSLPDGLLWGVNLLPLLMTAFNAASVFAYVDSRGERSRALALAALFLVLLYRSPSGLVLYWTTNNLFSLLRNLVLRRWLARVPPRWTQAFAAIAQQQ